MKNFIMHWTLFPSYDIINNGQCPLHICDHTHGHQRRKQMKLRDDFITQNIDDVQFLVPLSSKGFSGIVKSNPTAAFIVDCLKKETTVKQITEKLCAKYNVTEEKAAEDVKTIIGKLRGIGAIVG